MVRNLLTTTIASMSLALTMIGSTVAFQSVMDVTPKRRFAEQKTSTLLHASVGLEEPLSPVTLGGDSSQLPPVLQQLVDERREFQLNLGKAMDTLKKDYPYMLKKKPDFSIYHDQIKVTDPSGVQLNDLNSYKNSFRFFQACFGLLYNVDRSSVQFRMVYDFARQSIRISWNAVLVPKIVGNSRNSLYIDGISVYAMDSDSGKIVEHRIEQMLINNIPVQPPYGVLTALSQELLNPVGQRVPVGVGAM